MSRFGVRAVLQFRRTSRRFAVRRARCVALVSAYAVLRLSSVRIELNILQAMKSRAGGASTAAAAAATWAENLGGGAGDHGRPGRQTCRAVWRDELAAFEVLQPRGDALRSMGTTWRGRTMLHAEEGLWLAERGMLTVQPFSNSGTSPPPAAAPSRASVASSEGDGQAGPRSSRPATAEEMGEQHRGENEKGDKIARGRIGAGVGCPTGAGERERKEDEEEEEVVVGQRSDDCSDGSSTAKADPPPSSTAGETTLSRIGLSTKRNFSGRAPAGNAEEVLDSGGPGGLASGAQGHGRRKRGGCKRGRSGSGGSERDGGSAPALSMSIEDLHASILPRAGVPWECYRAYAELKRRSYVVRRQPEDMIGHDDTTPRAAALSWFRHAPAAARSRKTVNRKANNGACAVAYFHTSTSSSSSSPPSSGPPASSPLPVTFHVYNTPPGSSPFRKRNPGPPDAVLAVCSFGDPLPDHCSLVALAERHAGMRKHARASANVGTSKPAEPQRGGRTGEGGGSVVGSEKQAGGSGGRRERGGPACGEPEREGAVALSEERSGEDESAPNLPRGRGSGGAESGLDVSLSDGARGGGERSSLSRQDGREVLSQRQSGEIGGGREGHKAGKGGGTAGLVSAAAQRSPPLPLLGGAVKLAVVSWEAGVQLFDVGLHDAGEVAQPVGASLRLS